MPRYRLIKMCNLSPIHIGTGKEDYDVSAGELHSDTLSAALASIGIAAGKCKDVKGLLSSIKISSAFPFWKNLYFLPKPLGRLNAIVDGQQEYEYRKRLKAVKYIESSLWQKIASGETLHIEEKQIRGQYLIPSGITIGEISKSQVSQRVGVSRDGTTDAEPFFFDWHYYDSQAGLYCLVDADAATMKTIVDLFGILGENGIGTDKSVGGGHFDVEVDDMEILEPKDADATTLLSLYIPTEEEMHGLLNELPRYTLMRRDGYMAGSSIERFRHLRKKAIFAFGVGSIFQTINKLEGKIVNVAPEWNDPDMHPVYRNGKPLTIKIKKN